MPVLGARGAAELQSAFLTDTIQKCGSISRQAECHLFLDGPPGSIRVPAGWHLARQNGRGLGRRLAWAFGRLFDRHERVIIIGTDSPELSSKLLGQALGELKTAEAVLGPCPDGGFYLIGLRRSPRVSPHRMLMHVRWGTSHAFRDILRNLSKAALLISVMESVPDIDRPADLKRLEHRLRRNRFARRFAPAMWQFIERMKPRLAAPEKMGRTIGSAIPNAAARFRTGKTL